MSARSLVPLVALGDGGRVLAVHPLCLAAAWGRSPSLFHGPAPYFAPGFGPLLPGAACCAGRSCHYAPCEHYGDCGCFS